MTVGPGTPVPARRVRFQAGIGRRAAAALAADFARLPVDKIGLLVDVEPGSTALAAMIEALTPRDSLTVVAGPSSSAVRAEVAAQGRWVGQRVRVVESLAEAEPADALVLAQPVGGDADELRDRLEALAKHLNPGAVISVAVPAAGFLAGEAGDELANLNAVYGVGADQVLRNRPPLKVYRLRYTDAEPGLAERLEPLRRTSSVALTRESAIDSNGIAAAVISVAAAVVAKRVRPKSKLWLVPLLAAGPIAAFFRDPHRVVPTDEKAVVSACDGVVLGVERLRDERLGDGEYLRISAFLSVLDVHVNRSPVAGRVVDQFVVDGGFAAAMKPAAEHNVAAYTVLDTPRGRVVVAQRTGLIARRIVHRAPVGSLLARGERFGLIRFGSRTDVYLPVDAAAPLVAPGDRVVGGETVIATWL